MPKHLRPKTRRLTGYDAIDVRRADLAGLVVKYGSDLDLPARHSVSRGAPYSRTLPVRLFISTILLCLPSRFLRATALFSGGHRTQASLQLLTDLVLVSLVVHEPGGWQFADFLFLSSLSWPAFAPAVWAHLSPRSPSFLRNSSRTQLLRRGEVLLHDSLAETLQGNHLRNLFCLSRIAYLPVC